MSAETVTAAEDQAPRSGGLRASKSETPVIVLRAHRVLPGRRQEFVDLQGEMSRLLRCRLRATGGQRDVVEDVSRPGAFVEVLRFPSREAWENFDGLLSKDRRCAAIEALLDDVLDPLAADLRVFEAPSTTAAPGAAR